MSQQPAWEETPHPTRPSPAYPRGYVSPPVSGKLCSKGRACARWAARPGWSQLGSHGPCWFHSPPCSRLARSPAPLAVLQGGARHSGTLPGQSPEAPGEIMPGGGWCCHVIQHHPFPQRRLSQESAAPAVNAQWHQGRSQAAWDPAATPAIGGSARARVCRSTDAPAAQPSRQGDRQRSARLGDSRTPGEALPAPRHGCPNPWMASNTWCTLASPTELCPKNHTQELRFATQTWTKQSHGNNWGNEPFGGM